MTVSKVRRYLSRSLLRLSYWVAPEEDKRESVDVTPPKDVKFYQSLEEVPPGLREELSRFLASMENNDGCGNPNCPNCGTQKERFKN